MKPSTLRLSVLVLGVATISSGAYWLSQPHADPARYPDAVAVEVVNGQPASAPETQEADATPSKREVLYWYDPMVPDQHFDEPGPSPFMDMDLVPKYANDGGSDAAVSISPALQQNFGVRTAQVTRTDLTRTVEAVGNIQFNDRRVAMVEARSAGYVEKTYDLAPGDIIDANTPLVDLLIPAWAGAQEEFIAVLGTGDRALINASRTRLQLTGMPTSLIADVERTRQAQPVYTVHAPFAGAIQSLGVREGMTLKEGSALATINGLETVWLNVAVPENQAEQVRVGQPVAASLSAYPDTPFEGEVIAVLPETDTDSRTLQVRIELPNPEHRLRPGMFARVALEDTRADVLVAPNEAIIQGGERDYVLVADDQGGFDPVVVTLGRQSGDDTEILSGLDAGQRVVLSGNFLIDSEASLSGALDRLGSHTASDEGDIDTDNPYPLTVKGVVEGFSDAEITLTHEPIPALNWPTMTMPFALGAGASTDGIEVGDTLIFDMNETDIGYTVSDLRVEATQ